MKIYLFAILILIGISGCATAPVIYLEDGAESVRVGKSDAGEKSEMIGAVTVVDGKDCGKFGYRGTYERAITRLRNKAYARDATYAQIMTISEPHMRGSCFNNAYTISATLYKDKDVAPTDSPTPAVAKAEPATRNADKLRELKKLHDDHVINDTEFEAQRKKILDAGI